MSVVIDKPQEEVFDIVEVKSELVNKYTGSPEVDALTTEIVLDDTNSIVKFGSGVADDLSKVADSVLNSMNVGQVNDTGKVLGSLTKIMQEFNLAEIQEDPKGVKAIFTNMKKHVDKIMSKYDTLGKELDKICIQLRQYQDEIQRNNQQLEDMFQANIDNYNKLEMYILAGEQGLAEIDSIIKATEEKANSGDDEAKFNLQTYSQAKTLLEGRVQDLRAAEQVAMQAVPMLRTMQFSNLNLVRKVDSAFIVTLPVFKQAIAQAIHLKRQRIQADAVAALDDMTNELLKKNASNVAKNSADIMTMVSQSSIKIETLQETYNTIMNGIKETQRIQADASKQRQADKATLDKMKLEFKNTYALPNKQ